MLYLALVYCTRNNKPYYGKYDYSINKARRVESLIFYQISYPFLALEITRDRYNDFGNINLTDQDSVIKGIQNLGITDCRFNLFHIDRYYPNLNYTKIFCQENLTMLVSGLIHQLEIFPELL